MPTAWNSPMSVLEKTPKTANIAEKIKTFLHSPSFLK
jgi:hypothetical protein